MALYDRLLGIDAANPKIPVHQFEAVCHEWATGGITAQQARDAIAAVSGTPLTAAEETEVQALVGSVPTGSTTANQAARALRLHLIACVLQMADAQLAPYTTAAAIKTRLGV